jgi:hypothetical protein
VAEVLTQVQAHMKQEAVFKFLEETRKVLKTVLGSKFAVDLSIFQRTIQVQASTILKAISNHKM